jgi:hypothetical protein
VYDVQLQGDVPDDVVPGQLAALGVEHQVCTVVSARFPDEAALMELLRWLRAFGLELLEVRRVGVYELTIRGELGPAVRAALRPYARVVSGSRTVLRTGQLPPDSLPELLARLQSRGLEVEAITRNG